MSCKAMLHDKTSAINNSNNSHSQQRRHVDGLELQGFACVWIIFCSSLLPEQLIFSPFLFNTRLAFPVKWISKCKWSASQLIELVSPCIKNENTCFKVIIIHGFTAATVSLGLCLVQQVMLWCAAPICCWMRKPLIFRSHIQLCHAALLPFTLKPSAWNSSCF